MIHESEFTPPETVRRYARVAGVAMLLSIVFGFLGEMILPNQIIVRGDPAATAANLLDPKLIRLMFASYLVEGICDILLCVLFYIILKPVDRNLALISAFFGIASMVTFGVAQSALFAGSFIVRDTYGMTAFTEEQRNALAYLATRLNAMIATLFLIMYGIATMIRGYLFARSGFVPRVIGILFMMGGAGFVLRTATYLLAPSLSTPLFLLPMALGGIPLMLWLLLRRLEVRPGAPDAAR
jgi:hypothetical protein